jgi:S-adenosylmethionine:tRNA ribosyltransferase-isomerase
MVLFRDREEIVHSRFDRLPDFLQSGEVIVLNESKVIPARLIGRKIDTGAMIEILLARPVNRSDRIYKALAKPLKRLATGTRLEFGPGFGAEVLDRNEEFCIVRLIAEGDLESFLDRFGETPLPPYITQRNPDDRERYQTAYARVPGSVAAPTAGLHFTGELMDKLVQRNILMEKVILHVGPGTFLPLRGEVVEDQKLDEEEYYLPARTAAELNRVRSTGDSLIAVGTTTTRVLESCADSSGTIRANEGFTSKYIYPGYRFNAVDVLITNFHLPRSSLLLLVSAFAGKDFILYAYREAIARRYRFYSYGDSMLIR